MRLLLSIFYLLALLLFLLCSEALSASNGKGQGFQVHATLPQPPSLSSLSSRSSSAASDAPPTPQTHTSSLGMFSATSGLVNEGVVVAGYGRGGKRGKEREK